MEGWVVYEGLKSIWINGYFWFKEVGKLVFCKGLKIFLGNIIDVFLLECRRGGVLGLEEENVGWSVWENKVCLGFWVVLGDVEIIEGILIEL